MLWGDTVWEFIQKGGIFIYPILACSVVGLAIFLNKIWVLRSKRVIPQKFLTEFRGFLNQGKMVEAMILSRSNNSPIARIAHSVLRSAHKDRAEIKEDIEEAGSKEASNLENYIEGLGAISNVSTLLGLLGTISGMIKIFRVISEQPIVNPPSLAAGISEALYTTALGLLVAIPSFIAYKYLLGRAAGITLSMEEEAQSLIEEILEKPFKEEKAREIAR